MRATKGKDTVLVKKSRMRDLDAVLLDLRRRILSMGSLKKKVVFVAMSGGVDSSVAALLLKKAGFDTVGVFMKNWTGASCPAAEDHESARAAAETLGIPLYTWSFEKEYRGAVFDYMLREYAAGKTPNPDVMCNKEIKFGVFLDRALKAGADFVATGHYARLRRETLNPKSETLKLMAGVDKNKDQSYFLWTLTQAKLSRTLFPIGEYTKSQVRRIAKEYGLPNAQRPDSQGLCFVGKVDFREFLSGYIPDMRGKTVTTDGRLIGEHRGIHLYTVGQRHGIGISGGTPYYVAAKDAATNTIVAVTADDPMLYKSLLTVSDLNWIDGKEPGFPLRCKARIRYRQPLQSCRIEYRRGLAGESATISAIFDEPQRAVAPGQSIVFYRGDELIGGGIIG